jgi:threonine synthase
MDKLFKTGIYSLTTAEVTSSPSMDISKASNYERLVFDVLGKSGEKTSMYMQEFIDNGVVDLQDYGASVDDLHKLGFTSYSSTHEDRLKTIKRVHDIASFVIDTHTADAVNVGWQYKERAGDVPIICMGTALPVKFEDSIEQALGFTPKRPERFAGLESDLPEGAFHTIDIDAEQLREYLRANI